MAAIGEDSSRQDMKKKPCGGKDRRRGGHEAPRGLEPRSLDSESSVLTVTPRDQLMEVTGTRDLSLGSAGRDQALQLTCQRGMKATSRKLKEGQQQHFFIVFFFQRVEAN